MWTNVIITLVLTALCGWSVQTEKKRINNNYK
mgnify:CR=1 FL=1